VPIGTGVPAGLGVAVRRARRLEPMLLHDAADPNRGRKLLVVRVACGLAWAWTETIGIG